MQKAVTPTIDVNQLRQRAREHIEEGAVTEGYEADRETVLKMLNDSLATEIVCVLRYRRHYFMARGIHSHAVAAGISGALERRAGACGPARRAHRATRRRTGFFARQPDQRSHAEYVEGPPLAT